MIDTRPLAGAGGPARCLREQASVFPAHGPRAGPKGCAGCAGMEAAAAETHRDPATHCPVRLSREVLRKPTRRRVGIGTPRSYHGSDRGAVTRDNLRLSRVRNRGLKSTITPAYHRVRNPVITGSETRLSPGLIALARACRGQRSAEEFKACGRGRHRARTAGFAPLRTLDAPRLPPTVEQP